MSTSRLLSNNRSSEDLSPHGLPDDNEGIPPEQIELQTFRRNTLNAEPEFQVAVTDDDSDDSDMDETYLLFTAEETNGVVRRLDRYLVPFLALLYMLSFLDRSSSDSRHGSGSPNVTRPIRVAAHGILYHLHRIRMDGPAVESLSCTRLRSVLCRGLTTKWFSEGIVPNFISLLLARAALGIAEAAFGPGVPLYLSFFYKREELAFRTGLFISAAPLSTAYAGSLAYLLTSLSTGLAPWRALFIIEGWPSLIAAVVAWWYIPDGPGDAWFLENEEERQIAVIRLQGHSRRQRRLSFFKAATGRKGNNSRFNWSEVVAALQEVQNWLTALMFFSCNVAFSSLPVFLPTIINEMGNTALASQALSAPPYVVAFITVILVSYFSDRLHSRGVFVINCALAGAFGYGVLAFAPQLGLSDWKWRYAAVYFAASGIFSAIAIIIPWTVGNSESAEGKGTGVAILNLVGQCGPLLGTRLYPAKDGPYYTRGMTICGAFMLAVAALAFVLRIMLAKENRKRDEAYLRKARGQAEAGTYTSGEGKGFRFML
ncbi:hypothetical protein ABW20_dc0102876 [Dactylellina cionopaga]|nr:hypothetical protein ABW20_dc0102876 [Dactylellina cionopaga]